MRPSSRRRSAPWSRSNRAGRRRPPTSTRVAQGAAVRVVVEVAVHIGGRTPSVGQSSRPALQGTPRVARVGLRPPAVEAHVSPVRCAPEGDVRTSPVREAQRGTVSLEHSPHVLGEPRRVPGFHRDAYVLVFAEGHQRGFQTGEVDLQGGRQLQQEGAEVRPESDGPGQQPRHGLGGVAEPPDVGQIATRLHGKDEVVGHAGRPFLEGRSFRESIEGVVHLHRGETLTVEPQPLRRAHAGGIEQRPPMRVLPP